MNYLLKNFLRGLAIVVPIVVTVWVVYEIFTRVDRLIALPFPGLGFLAAITFLILIGIVASNYVGRKLFQLTEALFVRAPFVKIVYSSIKDLTDAFVGDRKRFTQAALVRFSAMEGGAMLGFITREDLSVLGLEGHVAVYFPQSYNIAGNLLLIERSRVTPVDIDSSKAMAFIVSGGVSGL